MRGQDLLYSLGTLAASLVGITFASFGQFYYLDKLHVRPELIGLAMVLYGIWNAINDPIFGHVSDNTRSRFGRRIPYVLFFSLPLAVSFALIWAAPTGWAGQDWKLFWYFLVTIFFFDGLFTVVILNWYALFPEMYKTDRARTSVNALRQVMSIVGYVVGFALTPLIYTSLGWTWMGVVYAAATAILLYAGALGLRENPEAFTREQPMQLKAALKASFTNRAFVLYAAAFFLLSIIFELVPAALPFYSKYVLGVPEESSTVVFAMLFLSSLVFLPLWMRVTNRKGARFAILATSLCFAAGSLPFLAGKDLVTGLVATAGLGVGLSGMMLLLDVLLADIIDDDRLRTGNYRAGFYTGAQSLVGRLAISIQGVVLAAVLSTTGYDPTLAVQPASALVGIKALLSFVPMVLALGAFVFFYLYPLRKEVVEANKRRLEALAVEEGMVAHGS